jgi:nitrate/nitrite transporter NarK
VSDKFGHRKWILAIHAALATIAYSLAIFTPSESELFIASMLFLGGFFCGGQMLTFAMAKESHVASMSGTAIAFINMIGISGALVFQPLVGYLIDSSQGNFQVAMYTIPGCLIATMLMSMMLKEKRLSEHQ